MYNFISSYGDYKLSPDKKNVYLDNNLDNNKIVSYNTGRYANFIDNLYKDLCSCLKAFKDYAKQNYNVSEYFEVAYGGKYF